MQWFLRSIIIIFAGFSLTWSQGYLALVGGGSEDYNAWSDPVYQWMVDKGDSGKVAVLSYSNQSDWIPDYFISLGAQSAVNMKFENSVQANDTTLTNLVRACKVVFIKGGNQYNYYSRWKNSDLQQAIIDVYHNGGVIAGTSAGAMILSGLFLLRRTALFIRMRCWPILIIIMQLWPRLFRFPAGHAGVYPFYERGRIGRLVGFFSTVEY